MRRAEISDLAGTFGTIANSAIWNAAGRHALDGLFLDARTTTRTDLETIRNQGRTPGIKVDPSWFGISGRQIAEWTHARLIDLGFVGADAALACDVCFDNEHHSGLADPSQDIIEMIVRWRQLRWKRQSYWSPEPEQAGWMRPELIQLINADINLGVVAQSYRGNMEPVAADVVRDDIRRRGIADTRCHVYYGAFYRDQTGRAILLPVPAIFDGILFDLDHAAFAPVL